MLNAKITLSFFILSASMLAGCNLNLDDLLDRVLPEAECAARQCQTASAGDCFREGDGVLCPGIDGCVRFEGQCFDTGAPSNPDEPVDPNNPDKPTPPAENNCNCDAFYTGFGEEPNYEACYDVCFPTEPPAGECDCDAFYYGYPEDQPEACYDVCFSGYDEGYGDEGYGDDWS